MKKLIPVILLVFGAIAVADTVIEEIVARVNSDIITRSELQRGREQFLAELRERYGAQANEKIAEKEKDALRDLIDQQLLIQKGKDLGITADTEVIKRLDDMRKQMNLESMEDLEKAAQEQGVSFEDFKENLRNQIITQQVIGREVGSKIQITQKEAEEFYEKHKAELERPEQVRLSEILVSTTPKQQPAAEGQPANTPPAPSEDDIAAAQQKADELLASIRQGSSFEDVAKKLSDGPTAAQGGELGYFKRGTLAKELEDKTFSMKTGEVSDVIRTKQGFIILKVTEHQQAGIPPYKEVEPRVQEAIYMRKLEPALRSYLTRLREEAYIDIKAGYVDTGASPNQTKPIMTTATTAPAKEKKKKKLGIF
ncbi:MAG: peptidylprolyl isomerase [Acidobacteriales bacterium]|nr:peptidylprolyl isomerase [Terriglobales bacterium]